MKSSCLDYAYFTSGRAVGVNACSVVLDPLGMLQSMLNTIYIFLLLSLMTHWLLSMYIIPFSSPLMISEFAQQMMPYDGLLAVLSGF